MPCWILRVIIRTTCVPMFPRPSHSPFHRGVRRHRRINRLPISLLRINRMGLRRTEDSSSNSSNNLPMSFKRNPMSIRVIRHQQIRRNLATVLLFQRVTTTTKTLTNSWLPCAPRPWPRHHPILLNVRPPMRENRKRLVICPRPNDLRRWDKRGPRYG